MTGIARHVGEVLEAFLGEQPPVHVECWDGSSWGDPASRLGLRLTSPDAIRRLVWDPDELGLGRAYVAGDIEVDGSIFDLLSLRDRVASHDQDVALDLDRRQHIRLLRVALRHRLIGRRPAAPPEEVRLGGRLHSLQRDRSAVTHHYDVGNDFYRLVLGATMTYSCALFPTPDTSLDEAQELKYEHVCRKLGLQPGQRLLDIGCGWGGMVLHAARHHGVRAVGITLSEAQADLARRRVEDAGLASRIEIRVQDYRELDDEPFDAVSSIGMFEHVGIERVRTYFERVRSLLVPTGRLLNHAISRTRGEGPLDPDSFAGRYVFPDGHLHEVGRTVTTLQDLGLECRDVESLREHYARTLRHWVAALEDRWDEAVALVGAPRARVWRLYMAGSAIGFEGHRLNVHQVLAVNTDSDGWSRMPAVRPATMTELDPAMSGQGPSSSVPEIS